MSRRAKHAAYVEKEAFPSEVHAITPKKMLQNTFNDILSFSRWLLLCHSFEKNIAQNTTKTQHYIYFFIYIGKVGKLHWFELTESFAKEYCIAKQK